MTVKELKREYQDLIIILGKTGTVIGLAHMDMICPEKLTYRTVIKDEWGTYIFSDEKGIAVPVPCRYVTVE